MPTTDLEMSLSAWLTLQTTAGWLWIHYNRKLHAMDDETIEDLEGQIVRMMDTATNNDSVDRLWAARRPNGACARKLAEHSPGSPE